MTPKDDRTSGAKIPDRVRVAGLEAEVAYVLEMSDRDVQSWITLTAALDRANAEVTRLRVERDMLARELAHVTTAPLHSVSSRRPAVAKESSDCDCVFVIEEMGPSLYWTLVSGCVFATRERAAEVMLQEVREGAKYRLRRLMIGDSVPLNTDDTRSAVIIARGAGITAMIPHHTYEPGPHGACGLCGYVEEFTLDGERVHNG